MPKRILVADDDPGIGDMLYLMLEDAGYDVKIIADGREVELLQEPLPDLLILDIWLSGIDGQTICRTLKGREATHALPIVLLSAHKETHQIARDAGADDFLTKPFEIEDLLALVAKYLGSGETAT